MESNFPYYYKYITRNKVNLYNILSSLIKQNLKFNNIAHKILDKESFIKADSEIIPNSLDFFLNCSKLFKQYIFDGFEEAETSNKNTKNILPLDIYNDFIILNEKYSKEIKEN